MRQRLALKTGEGGGGGGGGDFVFMKAFIYKHPVNQSSSQLTKKYFKHLKTKNFTNEGYLCKLSARANLVTQVAEVTNFSCWSTKSRLGQKPTKNC